MAWVGDTIWGESGRKPVADLTQILSHPTSFELTFKVILNLFSFHFISVADRIQPYDPPTILWYSRGNVAGKNGIGFRRGQSGRVLMKGKPIRCIQCYKQRPGGRCSYCPLHKKNRSLYRPVGDGWYERVENAKNRDPKD